ncbi:NADH-ubiquinone reductase complex 1 MLRQ subunit [Penicillium desertorum]|uniref:NADH-ubiquinone reductase complex 1 MLRQ subunit n=1 Tax=Penicillium desertorum TaxID=1303715 RepID=A0A9W9WXZ1_9EURO|nr:NADH-ubiquinone reductase complex 1 MLRQ subunit [Penicillium desertorum]
MYPTRMLRMQPTRAFYFPTPKEQQSAIELTTRLQPTLSPSVCVSSSVCPPELLPIGFVLAVAIGAAIYSSGKKLMTDKTLRLYRNSPESREH